MSLYPGMLRTKILLTDVVLPPCTGFLCSFSFCFSSAILKGFWIYGPIVGILLQNRGKHRLSQFMKRLFYELFATKKVPNYLMKPKQWWQQALIAFDLTKLYQKLFLAVNQNINERRIKILIKLKGTIRTLHMIKLPLHSAC